MIVQQSPPIEGILLVRTDGQLRDFCRGCLKRNGFRALEAADGLEALLIALNQGKPVDFFITDIENSRISGIGLASILQSISPQMRVVILSGSGEQKRKVVVGQIRQLRKARSAYASQASKLVVTWRRA